MKYICPLIVVSNVAISRNFYEKILNQKVKYDFGENIIFEGDFSIHKLDHYRKLIGNKEVQHESNSFELYFEDDKLEELESKLKENNIEFLHEIKEQPWRQRVMRFYDPDKNIIEVGESMELVTSRLYLEGMELNEISRITMLPKEYISDHLKEKGFKPEFD